MGNNYDIGVRSTDNGQNDGSYGEIDWTKLWQVTKKSLPWIIVIFVSINIAAYIIVRYTKPIYESSSEIKLNIKKEASQFGFGMLSNEYEENQNINTISGEIELIRSKLFFRQLIKNLDLNTKYETNFGTFNNEERYKKSPFKVIQEIKKPVIYDKRFIVDIIDDKEFLLSYTLNEKKEQGKHYFGDSIKTDFFTFQLFLEEVYFLSPEYKSFVFIPQSDREVINYIDNNLTVQPLNFKANTIQIKFKDHNPIKARDLVNAIDSIYLTYSKEEKSKANSQKISFLNEQLKLTGQKLEGLDNYFEDFTIDNKTTNVQKDITRTILMMEELDSQRYLVEFQITKIEELKRRLKNNTETEILPSIASYPKEINEALNELYMLDNERKLLLSSYNENTYAVRKKNEEFAIFKETENQRVPILFVEL